MTLRLRQIPALIVGFFALTAGYLYCCLRAFARRLLEFDQQISHEITEPAEYRRIWYIGSRLGDGWVYAIAVLALRHSGEVAKAGHVAGCVVTAWGSSALLKMLVRRRRRSRKCPCFREGWPDWDHVDCQQCGGSRILKPHRTWFHELNRWSFPSQHAACVVAFMAATNPFGVLGFILGLFVMFICASRVAIGAHYLGDVLAGIAVGVAAGVWG